MPDPCKEQRKALQNANRAYTDAEKTYRRSGEVKDDKVWQHHLDGSITAVVTVAAVLAAPESGGASMALLFGVAGGAGAGAASGWFGDEDELEEAWDSFFNAEENLIEAHAVVKAAAKELKHCEEKHSAKSSGDDDMPAGDADLLDDDMPAGDLDILREMGVSTYDDVETTAGGNLFFNTRLDHGVDD